MSAKNNLGKAHERRLLHPPREEQERKTEGNVEGEKTDWREGWDGEGKEGGGSETLTHSHAGLSGLLRFLPPARTAPACPVPTRLCTPARSGTRIDILLLE